MAAYNIRGDGLTEEEAQRFADSDAYMDEVFACDLSGLMREYDEAIDFIQDVVVFGETYGYELEDWTYNIVGFEDGNVLHLRIVGNVVPSYS